MIRSVNVCPNCDSTYINKFIRKEGYKCKTCKSKFKEPKIRKSTTTEHRRINFIVGENSPLRNTKFIW